MLSIKCLFLFNMNTYKLLLNVINNDINNLLNELIPLADAAYNKDFIKNRYMPCVKIKKKKKRNFKINTTRKKYVNHYVPSCNYRCIARCWGGEESVKYDPFKKEWSYGTRCKRRRVNKSEFCQTHLKHKNSMEGLRHGIYNLDPPHLHYLKYKRKIEKRYNIK